MELVLLDVFTEFAKGMSFTLPSAGASTVMAFAQNPNVLAAGIALIIISAIVFFLLKKVIEHAIIGAIAWALTIFVFHISLPLIPSLVIAIIFGPAGIGAMLLLRFFGLF
jgi:hypothetical protein